MQKNKTGDRKSIRTMQKNERRDRKSNKTRRKNERGVRKSNKTMQKNKRSQKELITSFNDHTKLIRTITSGDDVGDKIKITESTSLTLTTKS